MWAAKAVVINDHYEQLQLTSPGGLVDEARSLYAPFKPKFRSDILEFTFPSGCKISFKALASASDLPGYDGTQFTRKYYAALHSNVD